MSSVSPNDGFSTPPSTPRGAGKSTGIDFDVKDRDFIVELIHGSMDNVVAKALDALFRKWGVRDFKELAYIALSDVESALKEATGDLAPLSSLLTIRKLGYIVEYAKFTGSLDSLSDMPDIMQAVERHKSPPTSSVSPSTSSSEYKKTVPTLPKFSGNGEDYFRWSESTLNELGKAGLIDALKDQSYNTKHPELSSSVFFALRTAVGEGHARDHAMRLANKGDYNAYKLWSGLSTYYDTKLERANATLTQVKKILELRLDSSITATEFIADWNECLTTLEKVGASLATDNDTLRALLLVAIQDDSYDTVRDVLVNQPLRKVDDILTDLRNREASMMIKDGAIGAAIDSAPSSGSARRASTTIKSKSRDSSPGERGQHRPWKVPPICSSFKKLMNTGAYNALCQWRSFVHGKSISPEKIEEEFRIGSETLHGKNNSGAKHGQKRSRSRRSKNSNSDSADNDEAGPSDSEETTRPSKRVRFFFLKDRRVVTVRDTNA